MSVEYKEENTKDVSLFLIQLHKRKINIFGKIYK